MARRGALIAAALVAIILGLFIALLAGSDGQRSTAVNFEIIGKPAPQIQGTTLAGDDYDLWSERGDWVVVNFFASWCIGCRVEHPELVEFSERHRDDGTHVVAVMFGDTQADAERFFLELGGDWPALVDRDAVGAIALDYGVTAVPETVLIAPSGRVVQKWLGGNGVTADVLDATIAQLSAGG